MVPMQRECEADDLVTSIPVVQTRIKVINKTLKRKRRILREEGGGGGVAYKKESEEGNTQRRTEEGHRDI